MNYDEMMQESHRKGSINTMYEVWSEKKLTRDMTRSEVVEFLKEMMLKEPDFYGATTEDQVVEAIDKYQPELLREKKDATVLIKEMREQAYTEGYVVGAYDEMKEHDMSDEETRLELIKMVQKQPRCGVHSKKEAEVVVDDILTNRMDEIREELDKIHKRRKECQR